jgi:hypothetical protein
MNTNFYANEQLSNIRHAQLIAEARAFRMIKQAEQSDASASPIRPIAFRPFGWLRQLVVRLAFARV